MKVVRKKELREEIQYWVDDREELPTGYVITSSNSEFLTIRMQHDAALIDVTLDPCQALDLAEFIHNWADERMTAAKGREKKVQDT